METIHTDPPVSEAQRRAMFAAAEGHSTLGIPEDVGKEFIKSDDVRTDKEVKAAGIAYMTDSKILLIQRGSGQDHPNEWAFPGGHLDKGEDAETAAIREFSEEVGGKVSGPECLGQFGKFMAYGCIGPAFDVVLSDESQAYMWADMNDLPEPMHPRALEILHSSAFKRLGMNELDIARAMSIGELPSPQVYCNVTLFDIRITGTAVCCRILKKGDGDKAEYVEQYAWREPSMYLNPDFLARCNGLPAIILHPDKGTLNSKEYASRNVGSVFLPYIKNDEVWAIAKIYDDDAITEMRKGGLSTSPCVVTRGDATLSIDGDSILIEGVPALVDHIAICEQGVWDKGGEPVGVNTNPAGASIMTEDEIKAKADAEAAFEKMKKDNEELRAKVDALMKKDEETAEEKAARKAAKKADKAAKRDAEEKAAKEAEEKAKADAEEKEAMRAKIDELTNAIQAKPDEEMNALSDAQAKADSVFAAFGTQAPRPITGEAALSYRRRIATKLQEHSTTWKGVDLSTVNADAFTAIEKGIHADAVAASRAPSVNAGARLTPRTYQGSSGHNIREWVGDQAYYRTGFDQGIKPVRFIAANMTKH